MKTVSFYSYKGGVGRSLALTYTAKFLADCNFTVCIVDVDLEAPGIIYKFMSTPTHEKQGTLDYIHACMDRKPPEMISDFFYTFHQTRLGYIKLMSSGKGLDNTYWAKLADIDWRKLFCEKDGEGLFIFELLKYQIKTQINPDFLFFDSRAGVTIMSQVCNSVIPDSVIFLLANNNENFHGAKLMYEHILASKFKANNKKTDVTGVLTRIPVTKQGDFSESDIINKLVQTIDVPNLDASDVIVIHSNRTIELDEDSLLKRKLSDSPESNVLGDYFKLITKIVKPDPITNYPKWRFIWYNIKDVIEMELDKLRDGRMVEFYYREAKRSAENEPVSFENLHSLALCQIWLDNPMDAIASLSMAISIGIDDTKLNVAYVRYLRGLIFLYDVSNYDEALCNLMDVHKLGITGYQHLNYHLSACLLCLEKFDEALSFVNKYLQEEHEDYRAFLLRAMIMLMDLRIQKQLCWTHSKVELDKVMSDFEKSITHNPQNKHVYNCRGIFYHDLGELQNALLDYSKAIEIDDHFARAYMNRGILYKDIGDTQKALNDYTKAIELAPDDVRANNRAVLYRDLSNSEVADGINYEKIDFTNPNSAWAYNNRGLLFKSCGELQNALNDYNKAIEISPSLALLYYNRGILHAQMGNIEQSRVDMEVYNDLKSIFE